MSESARFFILWDDPTKPDKCEIDATSFANIHLAENYINYSRAYVSEEKTAYIMELVAIGRPDKPWEYPT